MSKASPCPFLTRSVPTRGCLGAMAMSTAHSDGQQHLATKAGVRPRRARSLRPAVHFNQNPALCSRHQADAPPRRSSTAGPRETPARQTQQRLPPPALPSSPALWIPPCKRGARRAMARGALLSSRTSTLLPRDASGQREARGEPAVKGPPLFFIRVRLRLAKPSLPERFSDSNLEISGPRVSFPRRRQKTTPSVRF